MSDLVGNPEDRFSRVEAHIVELLYTGVNIYILFFRSETYIVGTRYRNRLDEYPQSLFSCKNKNNRLSPVYPRFTIYEPPRGKTNNLHRRKQRRRSASR